MKKMCVAAIMAAAVIYAGIYTVFKIEAVSSERMLSMSEANDMVEQGVRDAVQQAEEKHIAQQQQKDARIAELEEQLEQLSRRQTAEQEQSPAVLPNEDETDAVKESSAQEVMPVTASSDISAPNAAPPQAAAKSELVSGKPDTEEQEEMPNVISFEVQYVGGGRPASEVGNHPEDAEYEAEGEDSDFDYTLEEFAGEIFYWTNIIRKEHGLPEFKRDDLLDEMAQIRATEGEHMTHTRPDGSTPDTIFAEYGSELRCTGENIAGAGGDPKHIAYGFLKTSHRRCVLDPEAEYLGVGCRWTDTVIGDRIAVLQLFAK